MAAGQIRAPIIVPLRPPQLSKTKTLTTDVKIDLASESADIDIYFTVNGSKPEPFKFNGDKNTFRFTVPFCLPSGKRIVKAIAVSKDGSRESNIVTKVYDIEQGDNSSGSQKEVRSDVYGFLDDLKDQRKSSGELSHQENKKHSQDKLRLNESINSYSNQSAHSTSIVPQYLTTQSSSNKKYGKMSDYLTGLNLESNVDMNKTLAKINKNKDGYHEKDSIKSLSDFGSQSLRLQRETDFLKCVYCLTPRPVDPLAKFCNSCGQVIPPLPISRLPPPENGQLGMCIHCRSTVPMNVLNCLVCEAPLSFQNQPQITNQSRERSLCIVCGTANPLNMESCLTCEAKLPEYGKTVKMHQPNQPPVPSTLAIMSPTDIAIINCVKCGRQNNAEARYCDWCGYKSSSGPNSIYSHIGQMMCAKCGANNQNNAIYCCQCGNTMGPPSRQLAFTQDINSYPSKNSITIPFPISNGVLKPDNLHSQTHSLLVRKNLSTDVSTQTVGLFYPSTAQLKKSEDKQRPSVANNAWEKAIPLSLVSPGKGYWRKQLEHVIAHMKAHASNSPEFQAMIGEPRMGKLIHANVQEEDVELNLTLTFTLKGYKDPYPREISDDFDKRYLNSMLKRTGSFDSFRSDDTLRSHGIPNQKRTPTSSSRCRSAKSAKASNKKKPQKTTGESTLSDLDRRLLNEIKKSGEGRATEIERLFDEGADPKAKNKMGVPFITVAVRNKHKEAIRMLYKLGANLNEPELENGNTPLHEAVLLGPLEGDIVNELLECGASFKIKNNKGENPSELAVKMKNDVAIKHFASKVGKNQIEKLTQPKQLGDSDDEKI